MGADFGIWAILLLAVVLGIDAFSLSIGVGMQGISTYKMGQFSAIIGVLHIILPLLGIYMGQVIGTIAGNIAVYLGSAVLVILGAKMIYEEFTQEDEEKIELGGWQFIVLPVSVSLDSLTIGFSLGTFGVGQMLLVTGTFGIVAALMTLAGILLGSRIGHTIEKTSILGGGILIILGLRMLFF